jgi:hypothetical protein
VVSVLVMISCSLPGVLAVEDGEGLACGSRTTRPASSHDEVSKERATVEQAASESADPDRREPS